MAAPGRRHPQQPGQPGLRLPAGRHDHRHRHLRLRQVQSGQPGAGRPGEQGPGRAGGGGGAAGRCRDHAGAGAGGRDRGPYRRRPQGRAGRHQAPDPGGPEAHRPHAPVQPGDIHRPAGPCAHPVRGDARGQATALRCRPLLLQRGQGALPPLRGRGLRHGGTAVPAQRLRPLPRLPRHPL
ncbi:hypothetical protein AZA_90483 [Nitrospirillum viridazoti Y2]|nr:hypothetical protein AZA_90483 [Nitrospirillum amazonense Y2]